MRARAGLALLLAGATPAGGAAQQWTTDDTGIVNARTCQLEVWHGERSPGSSPRARRCAAWNWARVRA